MPGSFLSFRCHYCSRFFPAWRVHVICQAQTICDTCLEWHNQALEFLAGRALPGCHGCGASWEVLRDRDKSVEVRLYVVPRDGIYQLLCQSCIRSYVPKRADLYQSTPFGTEVLKLL